MILSLIFLGIIEKKELTALDALYSKRRTNE
jgi:hypothetical protein